MDCVKPGAHSRDVVVPPLLKSVLLFTAEFRSSSRGAARALSESLCGRCLACLSVNQRSLNCPSAVPGAQAVQALAPPTPREAAGGRKGTRLGERHGVLSLSLDLAGAFPPQGRGPRPAEARPDGAGHGVCFGRRPGGEMVSHRACGVFADGCGGGVPDGVPPHSPAWPSLGPPSGRGSSPRTHTATLGPCGRLCSAVLAGQAGCDRSQNQTQPL